MYRTVSLLVYAFGLAAFLGLFVLWVRQRRLTRPQLTGWIYPTVFLTSAAWFALNLLTSDYLLLLAAACAFPPLLEAIRRARVAAAGGIQLGCRRGLRAVRRRTGGAQRGLLRAARLGLPLSDAATAHWALTRTARLRSRWR